MITGSRIILRGWKDKDVPALTVLRNDIKLQALLLSRVKGSDCEDVKCWLKNNSDRLTFIVSESITDNMLGFIQVSKINTIDSHGELGICLLENAQGRGYGTEAITIFMAYLQNFWGLKKIVIKVRGDNIKAMQCYKNIGFESCGKMKNHFFIEGCWHDIIIMECHLK